jgi:lysophospholipase
LKETFQLSKLPSPKIPCITFLAEDERIVDPIRVRNRMKVWSNGELNFVPSARHEVLMEDPTIQKYIIRKIVAFFQSNEGLITS